MLAAFISGLLAIRVLLAYVRTRTYRPFVFYRLAFALLVWTRAPGAGREPGIDIEA